MSLYAGSSALAHALDRFALRVDFEDVAGEAARLNVTTNTLRRYRDWYGEEPTTVMTRSGLTIMPAYESQIRWQVLGEKIRLV